MIRVVMMGADKAEAVRVAIDDASCHSQIALLRVGDILVSVILIEQCLSVFECSTVLIVM